MLSDNKYALLKCIFNRVINQLFGIVFDLYYLCRKIEKSAMRVRGQVMK